MPTDRPPKTPGRAPGRTTENSTRPRPPPIVRTASSHTGLSARTACRVETTTGKKAAAKVMKTIPCSLEGNSRIATGTSAMAGTGRSTSSSGPSRSSAIRDRATAVPTATPEAAASAKPDTIRRRLEPRSCQYAASRARCPKVDATSPTVGNCSKRSHRFTSSEVSACHSSRAAPSEAARSAHRPAVMTPGPRPRRSPRSAPPTPGARRRTPSRPPG